jgi:hypothetical protein
VTLKAGSSQRNANVPTNRIISIHRIGGEECKVGSSVGRAITGIVTGGLSEVARAGTKALTPKIPPRPKIPERSAIDNKASILNERKRKGRRSTILTGSRGIQTETLG